MTFRFLVSVLFGVSAATRAFAAETPVVKPSLDQLAWLAGHWSLAADGRVVTEQWMAPDGGTMLGMSRTVAGDRTVAYEFVVLRAGANGEIFYEAHPSGQEAASFKLVRWAATEVVFENLEHNFPQRIIYRLSSDGKKLDAAVEGTKNGKARRVEFPYQRVALGDE